MPRPACLAAEMGRLSADTCTPPRASLRSRSASPSRSRAVMSASCSSIMFTPPASAATRMSSRERSPYRVRSETSSNNGADGRLYLLDTAHTPGSQICLFCMGSADLTGRSLDTRAVAQADRLAYELGNHLVAVETGDEQRTIHAVEHVEQELVRQLKADVDAALTGLFHFAEVLARDNHARQLVVAELGMAIALQGHDLDDGRNGRIRHAAEEEIELLQVVQRLGDGEIGASI